MQYLRRAAEKPGTCPDCSSSNRYEYKSRTNLMKCADCGMQFTPSWWTPFYRRKLPVATLLQIAEMRLGNNTPMLQIAKHVGVDYKTVWSFCKKLDAVVDALS